MPGRIANERAPHQLPSGRHGLPRSFVASNQRERILDATLGAVAAKGYPGTRVADVIRLAGVSRRTFYDHFPNKEEAFLAAYDLVVEQMLGTVAAAFGTGDTWPSRVHRALAAFLRFLASEPTIAHVCFVDTVAAGPRALQRRRAAMAGFRRFMPPSEATAASLVISPVTAETVIGGLYEVIYARVIAGQTQELPALLPALLYSVLLPFAGMEIAAAEHGRALAEEAHFEGGSTQS